MRRGHKLASAPAEAAGAMISEGPPEAPRAVALLLMTVILAVRPLLSEVFESVSIDFLDSLDIVGGITPQLTLVLDLALVFLCQWLVIYQRAAGWSPRILWILAALAIAVGLSTWGASNRRLALNAGLSMFACAYTAVTLIHARGTPPIFRRTLLSACLATLVVFALKCWLQVYVEFPETRADWEQRKTQLSVEGYRPELINFERRLLAAEASGYQAHSNVAASLLMMGLLPLAGLSLAIVRRSSGVPAGSAPSHGETTKRIPVALIACAAGLFVAGALCQTGSAGAYGSTLVGLALLMVLQTNWSARRPAWQLLVAFVSAYALCIAAGIGWGLAQDTLPQPSLAFRWEYWTAGWKAWLDQPWTGLGRENFLAGYLQHKQAWATEEVRNPHSLWATLLFELGPLGLVSGGVLLVGAIAVCLRAAAEGRSAAHAERRDSGVDSTVGAIYKWLAVVAPALVIILQAGAGENHFDVPGWISLWLTEFVLPWLAAYALLNYALAAIEESSEAQRVLAASIAAAVVAAIFHNTIDYSLATPAGQSVLIVLLATASMITANRDGRAALAGGKGASGPRVYGSWINPTTVVLTIFYAMIAVIPGRATYIEWPRVHRELQRTRDFKWADNRLRTLLKRDPLDPTMLRSATRTWLRSARGSDESADCCTQVGLGRAWVALAIQRDPRSLTNVRLAADVEVVAARCATNDSARLAALEATLRYRRRATELYPTDPRGQIQLAIAAADYCGVASAIASSQPTVALAAKVAAAEGLAALERALEIDATRKPIDVVRLQPVEIEDTRSLRERLSGRDQR